MVHARLGLALDSFQELGVELSCSAFSREGLTRYRAPWLLAVWMESTIRARLPSKSRAHWFRLQVASVHSLCRMSVQVYVALRLSGAVRFSQADGCFTSETGMPVSVSTTSGSRPLRVRCQSLKSWNLELLVIQSTVQCSFTLEHIDNIRQDMRITRCSCGCGQLLSHNFARHQCLEFLHATDRMTASLLLEDSL